MKTAWMAMLTSLTRTGSGSSWIETNDEELKGRGRKRKLHRRSLNDEQRANGMKKKQGMQGMSRATQRITTCQTSTLARAPGLQKALATPFLRRFRSTRTAHSLSTVCRRL